jgi:hypothetical protein
MLLVGFPLAAQTTETNVSFSAGGLSSLLPPSEAIQSPGSSLGADAIGDTLHVDLAAFDSALGLTSGGTFYAAARLSPTKACTVATVLFYKWDASYDDYLYVWGKGTPGSPGQLIESVPYSGAIKMAWQTVNLPVLVPLADNKDDIWVGPRINHAAGTYPLGIDGGPTVAGRGGWINADGRWIELSSLGYDVNWHIRAMLGHGAIPTIDVGTEVVLAPKDTVVSGPVSPQARIRNFGANPVSNVPVICQIDSVVDESSYVVFTDTATYTGPLAPSETVDVTFPKSWTGVAHKNYYQVAIFTKLPEDPVHSNDTAHAPIIPTIDVGAEAVLAPKDTVVSGPVSPKARIRNFGFNPVSNVPVICRIDSAGTNVFTDTATYAGPLAPSETADVTFAKGWTGVAHTTHYQVAIFTKLPEDSVQTNDTAHASVVPTIDVGAETVLAPSDTVAPGPDSLKARIRNFGYNRADSVPVICRIDSAGTNVFTDTTRTGSLARSGTANVTFPKIWTGVVGNTYQVTVFTKLPADPVQINDTVHASVTVQYPGVEERPAKLGGTVDNVLPTLARDRVRINFTVARLGMVNLGVYDAAGSLVRTLVNGTLEPGSQSATWDRTNSNGRRVANGAYFYRLTVDGRTVSGKSVIFN